MLSKMVTVRLKDLGLVLSALQTVAPRVASRAQEVFTPYLRENETLPDFPLVATLVQRLLEDRAKTMEVADTRHDDELSDDAEPREARDAAQRDLYASVVQLKLDAASMFGAAWHAKLKLPREVPQDAAALWRLAGEVANAIREANFPTPRLKGVKVFDVQPWIDELTEPFERLGKALADVSRETREAQATQIEKNRAIAAYDEVFSTGIAFAAALLRLLGEHELADRLRPSVRRPGTLEPEGATEPPA